MEEPQPSTPTSAAAENHSAVQQLIDRLASRDGVSRYAARRQLVHLGPVAVPCVIRALRDHRRQVRWEIAKVLGEIADPIAASALVESLEDRDSDVRWLAAEALTRIGRDSMHPLLTAILDRPDSDLLRHGAHHVFHDLVKRHGDTEAAQVLAAMDEAEPEVHVPPAAYAVLRLLRQASQK